MDDLGVVGSNFQICRNVLDEVGCRRVSLASRLLICSFVKLMYPHLPIEWFVQHDWFLVYLNKINQPTVLIGG